MTRRLPLPKQFPGKPTWKMPPRLPDDGSVAVRRFGDDHLLLCVEGSGVEISISRYNAARIFGMLGMFLEIPLSKAASKGIILTPPDKKMDVTFGSPEPKTVGERVAQALIVEQMPERIGDFEKVEPAPKTTDRNLRSQVGRARANGKLGVK